MDSPARTKSTPQYMVSGQTPAMTRRATAGACLMVVGWYLFVFLAARPLCEAPVVDSWIYAHAVRVFEHSGALRFLGYTQAMPVAQVLWGAAWSKLFGDGFVSLELSVALLGVAGALTFFALARRSGARASAAALATALLIANPCYLFLSFSFMTEIPFLALLLAAHLAFAAADDSSRGRWLWVSAAAILAAFMVRPFAAAAIAGSVGALLVFNPELAHRLGRRAPGAMRRAAGTVVPFAAALALCALGWLWTMRVIGEPRMLQLSAHRVKYFFTVPAALYLRAGVMGPILYLGLVLSPMAIPQLLTKHWRVGLGVAAALMGATVILTRLAPGLPVTPELSCFGGWRNALCLRGLPTRFSWEGSSQWLATGLSALGGAGLLIAWLRLERPLNRAAMAVMLTAAVYWCGIFPLWLFNDRYYLVMVPAGCLLLALAPPVETVGRAAAVAGVIFLGLVSAAGVYDHQRGLEAVVAARDTLERSGVPRSAIDAGYPLNAADLYPSSGGGAREAKWAPKIPMVTSTSLADYTIAAAPVSGTRILRRFAWPGPLAVGHRELYVLQRSDAGLTTTTTTTTARPPGRALSPGAVKPR